MNNKAFPHNVVFDEDNVPVSAPPPARLRNPPDDICNNLPSGVLLYPWSRDCGRESWERERLESVSLTVRALRVRASRVKWINGLQGVRRSRPAPDS